MAILAALFGLVSRFFGRVLTTTLGWASTLLFGRVPASRQVLLAGLTFGSLAWVAVLAGIVWPDAGAFLIALVPGQDLVPDAIVRLAMLIAAAVIPAVVGLLTLALTDARRSPRGVAVAVARGYPLTALLAVLLVFLAVLAVVRKLRSLAGGRTDTHVPIVVRPGAYEEVARDLDGAVTAAGIEVEPRPVGAAMSTPARWLARVAGSTGATLVPDRMVELHGADLDILIYPMDVLISGRPTAVARARAAIASRLTTSHAHLTVTAEAQGIEDRLTALARREGSNAGARVGFDDEADAELSDIDRALAGIELPYEEWEVLYRQRLQVERDLRRASMASTAASSKAVVGDAVAGIAEALGDPDTVASLDRAVGWRWRIAVAVASIVVAVFGRLAAPRGRRTGPGREAIDP